MVVDERVCHTALHSDVKAKENQDNVPTLYWLLQLHKNPIKQDILQILVLVRQLFQLVTSCLAAVKYIFKVL